MCVLCVLWACEGVCESVDLFVCWHPTLSQLFLWLSLFCLLVAATSVSCLYHTVPQALKLSTLWQPRYNSSPTTKFLWTTSMRVLALHMSMWMSMTRKHVACVNTAVLLK